MPKKNKEFKSDGSKASVIIMVGTNQNGRIRKPITSIKIQGIPTQKVLEWLENAIASELEQYGTLDMDVIQKLAFRGGKIPCN